MSLKRKAALFGAALGVGCGALTLLTVWSSHGLTAAAAVMIVILWLLTGAFAGAAYYQEKSRKVSD